MQNLFEEKAQNILRFLKSDLRYGEHFLPRPFVGEITGTPAAGKSMTIDELDKFFKRHGFRVRRIHEGAEVIRHIDRSTPLYNLRTGLYALELLIDICAGHLYDIVLFDRGIFDAYCWMTYWLEKGELSVDERNMIQGFFLSRFWEKNIDVAYFFICEAEEAIRREHRVTLSKKLGATTNPETINKLIRRYQEAYKILSPKHKQLFLIDTTHLDEQKMIEGVATQMFEIFEQKAKAALK